jgi:hypothetical protein
MATGDENLLHTIDKLVHEEQDLYKRENLDDHGLARLDDIKVKLDQCWDLLRQRRAKREFGEDPDKAKERPAKIVENYEQ